jgi:hypothetical protein
VHTNICGLHLCGHLSNIKLHFSAHKFHNKNFKNTNRTSWTAEVLSLFIVLPSSFHLLDFQTKAPASNFSIVNRHTSKLFWKKKFANPASTVSPLTTTAWTKAEMQLRLHDSVAAGSCCLLACRTSNHGCW